LPPIAMYPFLISPKNLKFKLILHLLLIRVPMRSYPCLFNIKYIIPVVIMKHIKNVRIYNSKIYIRIFFVIRYGVREHKRRAGLQGEWPGPLRRLFG